MNREELASTLKAGGIDVELPEGQDFLGITLPGEKRLKTQVLIFPGHEAIRFEAFVCRAVEENFAEVYKYLLQRNRKSFGVAYTLDTTGDIYLTGNVTANSSADDYDRVLGQILTLADGDFNRILELGFATSIRREWAWRLDRGESTRNLEAFQSLRPSADEIPGLLKKVTTSTADSQADSEKGSEADPQAAPHASEGDVIESLTTPPSSDKS